MDFPFDHSRISSNVTHTHHHNPNDDTEQPRYPPPGHTSSPFNHQPPPPFYGDSYPPPPLHHQPETQVFHTGHVSRDDFQYPAPPPPQPHSYGGGDYPPAPPSIPGHSSTPYPNTDVHHVSHESHHSHHPHFPTSVHHVNHEVSPVGHPVSSNKRTVKILTKASPNYSLTIRRGEVVLAPSDPLDQHQHWYKDEKWSTKVKDEDGHPSFALVNKVTGEAIKHSIAASHPVRLVRYNPDYLDQSILWTESKDIGNGYRAVRMVNNVHLNMDAFHGDKNSGGVHDGTTVVLWDWNSGDNQQWKILQYCKISIHNIIRIPDKSLLLLLLAQITDDKSQQLTKHFSCVTDYPFQ